MERKLKRLQTPRAGIQYIIGSEIRKELNPFAFFDAGTMTKDDEGFAIGMHPHSGIGIITYFEGVNLVHDDSGNNDGLIESGGVQWINAGGGIWHSENYKKMPEAPKSWEMALHQLWFQLPPELEEGEIGYQNIQPQDLPVVDNVKVVAGTYEGQTSPLDLPFNLTYLDINLKKGERFEYQTPQGQDRGFVFPRKGSLRLYNDELPLEKLSILEDNEGQLIFEASSDTAFVLILAEKQEVNTVTQAGSIHSNAGALQRSSNRINARRPN